MITHKQHTVGRRNGQKPVTSNIAAQGCVLPQQAIWLAIRKAKKFDLAKLCSQLLHDGVSGINEGTMESYLKRLTRGGYLSTKKVIVNTGGVIHALHYTLERDVGNEAPRLRRDGSASMQGAGNDNLWRSIKILGVFSYVELVASANTDEVTIKPGTAKVYLRRLWEAGYLSLVAPGGPNKPARYQLIPKMNTGPRAPMVQRTHRVFDPNLKQIMGEVK